MNEKQFIKKLRENIKNQFPTAFHWKTFNPTLKGESDLNIILNGRYYKIEVKYVKNYPKKVTTDILKHRFSMQQITFSHYIEKAGGYGFGLVGIENDIYKIPITWMQHRLKLDDLDNFTKIEYNKKLKGWDLFPIFGG